MDMEYHWRDGEMYVKNCELKRNVPVFKNYSGLPLENRCIHSSHGKSPFEKLFGKPPDLNHLKVPGCKAFEENEKRKKFDGRAEKGFLLVYSSNSKIYLIGSFGKRLLETLQTRNVTFNERAFPG